MPAGDRMQGHSISAVILAAGEATRMGGPDKLTFLVGGMPLLRKLAVEALHSRSAEVVVALRPDQQERMSALSGLDVGIAGVERARDGLSESLKSGIAATSPKADGAMILLADMPEIQTRHINLLIDGFRPGHIVQAGDEGRNPGNPVIIPRCLFPAVLRLSGDVGARQLIEDSGLPCIRTELPGSSSRLDLDTREQWRRWRSGSDPWTGAGGGI